VEIWRGRCWEEVELCFCVQASACELGSLVMQKGFRQVVHSDGVLRVSETCINTLPASYSLCREHMMCFLLVLPYNHVIERYFLNNGGGLKPRSDICLSLC
jgi:hypothetical protein